MAKLTGNLMMRADKVAFVEINNNGSLEFRRMQGFTGLSINKNPKEYTRQYVDQKFEDTDVVGYSPSMDFAFDRYKPNLVHDLIANIIDNEYVGTFAVIRILVVDMTEATNNAYIREYSVIANSEGDSMDAYTYSGTLNVKGTKEVVTATVSADGLTATVAPSTTFTVTYLADGAEDSGTPPTDVNSPYVENSTVTVMGQGTLMLAGSTFDGWNDGTKTYTEGQTFGITKDTVLTAEWV